MEHIYRLITTVVSIRTKLKNKDEKSLEVCPYRRAKGKINIGHIFSYMRNLREKL